LRRRIELHRNAANGVVGTLKSGKSRTGPPDLLVRGTCWHVFAQVLRRLRSLVNQKPQITALSARSSGRLDASQTWYLPFRQTCHRLGFVLTPV